MINEQQMQSNPLLKKLRIPGRTFRLPSGGLFYKNGELADSVTNGEIHVYPMTAMDEIIMKSPDKLLNGDALYDVIANCVPDVLKPKDLLSKDVDFIMVCMRAVSHGSTIEVSTVHEGCKKDPETRMSFDIPLDQFINNAKNIDPTSLNNKFSVELENGQKVNMRPPKISDIIGIFHLQENDDNFIRHQLVKTISSMIDNIISDGEVVDNKALIEEWVAYLPVKFIEVIYERINEISDWGPKLTTTVDCKHCGEQIEIDTFANPLAFFF